MQATRFALKLGEHTDGRDVKSNLKDNYSWRKADFDKARAPGSKNYSQCVATGGGGGARRAEQTPVAGALATC